MRKDVEQLIHQPRAGRAAPRMRRRPEREMAVDLDDRAEAPAADQERLERCDRAAADGRRRRVARARAPAPSSARVALGRRERLLDVHVRAAVERGRRRVDVRSRWRADVDDVRASFTRAGDPRTSNV